MKAGVKETIAIRYMIWFLGVNVETASLLCGDNMGVIQNSTIKSSLLKNKHVSTSYHKTREAAASGIVHRIKTDRKINYADVFTKSQDLKTFQLITGSYFYGLQVRTFDLGNDGFISISIDSQVSISADDG